MSNILLPATFTLSEDGRRTYHAGFQDIEWMVKQRAQKWITLEELQEIENIKIGDMKEIDRILSYHI